MQLDIRSNRVGLSSNRGIDSLYRGKRRHVCMSAMFRDPEQHQTVRNDMQATIQDGGRGWGDLGRGNDLGGRVVGYVGPYYIGPLVGSYCGRYGRSRQISLKLEK